MEKKELSKAKNALFGQSVISAPEKASGIVVPEAKAEKVSPVPFDHRSDVRRRARRRGAASAPAREKPIKISAPTGDTLPVERLQSLFREYQMDGEIQLFSPQTLKLRQFYFKRLVRFLDSQNFRECGGAQLKHYFATLQNETTGEAMAISTNERIRRFCGAFWNWMMAQGHVACNAMDAVPKIPRNKVAAPQVQPFSGEQMTALLRAATRSPQPRRDNALVRFLLDTGARADEVSNIRLRDMDTEARSVRVFFGKGDKNRSIFYGPRTARAMWDYWRERGVSPESDPDAALFTACSGPCAGLPITRSGLYQAIQKLCVAAGITDGKMGPHRLRHTFATEFTRAGAYADTTQEILGHADPRMTQRYVKLARADMQRQHAKFSPVERLEDKRRP